MDESPIISTENGKGATVRTVYAERTMRVLAVFETEVDALSSLNTQSTVFSSFGSAALSFAIGIWTNAGFSEKLTPIGSAASMYVAPLFLAIGIMCFGVAAWAYWKRRKTLIDIRLQSK